MPYQPKSEEELFQSLLARVVEQSKLTDVVPGSPLTHILGTVSKEIYKLEYRLKAIRDSFNFQNAFGTDLDDRLSDLPPAGLARLPAKFAAGDSMRLKVDFVVGTPVTVPAGTRYARSDNPDIEYIQVEDLTIPGDAAAEDGLMDWPNTANTGGVRVVCGLPGIIGNVGIGVVDTYSGGVPEIIGATNVFPIDGGAEEESDAMLKERASLYIASLSRITAAALEYIARSFMSTPEADGEPVESFRHVRVYESSFVPGYTELMVDTGSSGFALGEPKEMSSYTTDGITRFYTWPDGAMHPPVLYHDAPSVDPLTHHDVFLMWEMSEGPPPGNVWTQYWYRLSHPDVKAFYNIPEDVDPVLSIPERGLLYLDPDYKITSTPLSGANKPVAISIGRPDQDNIEENVQIYGPNGLLGAAVKQYLVFTGAIAEFQAIIEGDPNDPIKFPGYRPAGCRVRVTLPTIQYMDVIDTTAEIKVGLDIDEVKKEILDAVAFYVSGLRPGRPFLRSELISNVMGLDSVLNFKIVTPAADFYPDKETYALRVNSDNISVG